MSPFSFNKPWVKACLFMVLLAVVPHYGLADVASTTVFIKSICGNGNKEGDEVCDTGTNTGVYSTSTANANCNPGCVSWGPYCGDGILQPQYGEECDDENNVSNDRCSALCKIEDLPAGGGGGGGYYNPGGQVPPSETKVVVTGKAYPNSSVHVLKDGEVVGVVQADGQANFYFATKDVTPGVATFGFWAQDKNGLKSVSLTTTLTVVAQAVTTISGAYIPPTIDIDKKKLAKGETLNIYGQSAPQVTVVTHVNSASEILNNIQVDSSGNWKLAFNTSPLKEEDFHTAQAHFETMLDGNLIKSSLSQSLTFYVGVKGTGKWLAADLNHDGKVNLTDFSILLFYWGTSGPVGDINEDKKVNITDFSIMLYYWTG